MDSNPPVPSTPPDLKIDLTPARLAKRQKFEALFKRKYGASRRQVSFLTAFFMLLAVALWSTWVLPKVLVTLVGLVLVCALQRNLHRRKHGFECEACYRTKRPDELARDPILGPERVCTRCAPDRVAELERFQDIQRQVAIKAQEARAELATRFREFMERRDDLTMQQVTEAEEELQRLQKLAEAGAGDMADLESLYSSTVLPSSKVPRVSALKGPDVTVPAIVAHSSKSPFPPPKFVGRIRKPHLV